MRRTALLGPLLGIVLILPGCAGFDEFLGNTFSFDSNPHRPLGDSLNMRRVQGLVANGEPIVPQTGNVWPKGVEPLPTLQDIEPEHGPQPRSPGNPRVGQSDSVPLPLALTPPVTPPAALAAAPSPVMPTAAGPTTTGPAIVASGTERYQTVSTPTGTAIVVPNGNGTNTLMRSDGSMETVPVPR